MYRNPVIVIETDDWLKECKIFQEKFNITHPIIITSKGNLNRLKLSTIFNSDSIFSNVKSHPTFDSCQNGINFSHNSSYDGVIAIGGGSVMDTAKAIMISLGTDLKEIRELIDFQDQFIRKFPSIFIPTTHGTGSEVTKWATVWNMDEKKKYSISHKDLYPTWAVLDGTLALSLPLDVSLSSTLDALSHSFEAIWNKNANPKSTDYAIEAICLILTNIDKLKNDLNSINLRNILIRASNIAALAISTTKTAAAHSISYPLTIQYNIPHGIACSLPLIPLLEINGNSLEKELNIIIKNLGISNFSGFINYLRQIFSGIPNFNLKSWGVPHSEMHSLIEQSFTKGRIENNIVDLKKDDIAEILRAIY